MDVNTLVQEGLPALATNATEGADNNAEHGTLHTIIEHLVIFSAPSLALSFTFSGT